MPDLDVKQGRYKSSVYPVTDKGREWLENNMEWGPYGGPSHTCIIIDNEFISELIEHFEQEGLTIDVKRQR